MPTQVDSRRAHTGVPGYFRGCCRDAAKGAVPEGYSYPGYHLTIHAAAEIPHTLEEDECMIEIESLIGSIGNRDDAAVLDWFLGHFPRCMTMIPKRRRDNFIEGDYRAAENEDCFTL